MEGKQQRIFSVLFYWNFSPVFSSLCKQIMAQRKWEAENIIKTAEKKENEHKDLAIALFISIWLRTSII